ncbi:MAG: hypothetical protein WB821_04880 [Burkholderiaceae bacterium]
MPTHHQTPDNDAIALLPPFARLGLGRIALACPLARRHLTKAQLVYAANDAYAAVWVFDAMGLSGQAKQNTAISS